MSTKTVIFTTPANCMHDELRPGRGYLDASSVPHGDYGRGSAYFPYVCQNPECHGFRPIWPEDVWTIGAHGADGLFRVLGEDGTWTDDITKAVRYLSREQAEERSLPEDHFAIDFLEAEEGLKEKE